MFNRYFTFRYYRNAVNTICAAVLLTVIALPCILYGILSKNLIDESNMTSMNMLDNTSRSIEFFLNNTNSIAVQQACNEPDIREIMFQNESNQLREHKGMRALSRIQATYAFIEYIAVYNERMNRLLSTAGIAQIGRAHV